MLSMLLLEGLHQVILCYVRIIRKRYMFMTMKQAS